MASNIRLPGVRTLTVAAPANVNSGQLVVVNQIFGVAVASALSAANVAISVGPTAFLPKANAVSTSQAAGSNVHWDATNAVTTVSATSNLKIGVCAATSVNTDTTVLVHLNPGF